MHLIFAAAASAHVAHVPAPSAASIMAGLRGPVLSGESPALEASTVEVSQAASTAGAEVSTVVAEAGDR